MQKHFNITNKSKKNKKKNQRTKKKKIKITFLMKNQLKKNIDSLSLNFLIFIFK